MDYIIRTLQSHHWGHCECTRYFLNQGNCKEISLENSECTSSAQVSIWWVFCPCPCSVFAVYQPGTPPFAPSDRQSLLSIRRLRSSAVIRPEASVLGRGVKGWLAGAGLFWFFGGPDDEGGDGEEEEGGERGGLREPPDLSEYPWRPLSRRISSWRSQ